MRTQRYAAACPLWPGSPSTGPGSAAPASETRPSMNSAKLQFLIKHHRTLLGSPCCSWRRPRRSHAAACRSTRRPSAAACSAFMNRAAPALRLPAASSCGHGEMMRGGLISGAAAMGRNLLAKQQLHARYAGAGFGVAGRPGPRTGRCCRGVLPVLPRQCMHLGERSQRLLQQSVLLERQAVQVAGLDARVRGRCSARQRLALQAKRDGRFHIARVLKVVGHALARLVRSSHIALCIPWKEKKKTTMEETEKNKEHASKCCCFCCCCCC